MKRLLVTGASGFLGWNVCRAARASWEVIGAAHSRSVNIDGVASAVVDLTDESKVRELFGLVRPDAAIHLAAASQPNFCQTHPRESRVINVDASLLIAALTAERCIPCVFTSTDLVFDGRCPPYREDDTVSPLSIYGEQKTAAERGMRERNPKTTICRMSLMFGDAGPRASSFLQPLVASLRRKEPVSLFADEFRTAACGLTAAHGLLLALDHEAEMLHLGGRERVSRYEFGLKLAAACGADPVLVRPARQRDAQMAAPRPADVSLDSTKAFALGYDPLTIEKELDRLECVRQAKR
jgi:dTDP-4-dehydrorhamnose reductase